MSAPLFIPAPFYMLRAPILPAEEFDRLSSTENLQEYLFTLFENDDLIREAILLASPELYGALKLIRNKTDQKQKEIASSLLRYMLRMTTRPTPFGLFSFVGLGKWGGSTHAHFEHQRLHKRARPDMEWLLGTIDHLCANQEIFHLIPVCAHPLAVQSSGRIQLTFFRQKNDPQSKTTQNTGLSIRGNELTTAILRIARNPLPVLKLEKKLNEQFQSLDQEKTRKVIEQLINQEILQISLVPSLLAESPFRNFLAMLDRYQIETPEVLLLKTLEKKLVEYHKNGTENVEDLIQSLCQSAEKIAPSVNYLQVDTAVIEEEFSLPKIIGEEAAEAAELLWQLSQITIGDPLRDYHAKFRERYGSRSVPLLELLDPNALGVPQSYLKTTPAAKPTPPELDNALWEEWLRTELFLCLQERRREITLTQEIVDQLLKNKPSKQKAPPSFDLFCQVIADSVEKIDQGDYELYLSSNTIEGGSTFGRFLDLLGPQASLQLKELYKREEALEDQYTFVEVSYYPEATRGANVAIHPNLRGHHLDLSGGRGTDSLSLDQIYVGALEDRFYLTNKDGDKEWIFRTGNVLWSDLSPVPLRFLKDVSSFRYQPLTMISWPYFDSSPFLPRIKFKKSILFPAQWVINKKIVEIRNNGQSKTLIKGLQDWMNLWDLPRLVYLTEGDNQILLDRHCSAHLEEITNKLKKGLNVRLVERMGENLRSQWLHSTKGSHFTELTIPFLKNPAHHQTRSLHLPKYHDIPETVRWKVPGSNWLFLKLYISEEHQERFLLSYVYGIANKLTSLGIIKRWFFVRYFDDKFHLRVRFQSDQEQITQALIPRIRDWSISLFQDKLIKDLQFGTYEREIERYGGEQLIDELEEFFCADTETVIDLLNMMVSKSTALPPYVIAAISLIDLLKGFGYTLEDDVSEVLASGLGRKNLEGIRKWKKALSSLTNTIIEERGVDENSDEAYALKSAFKKRANAIKRLTRKKNELQSENILTQSIKSIQNSLIHMHCNRLIGLDHHLESKARLYAEYALATQRHNRRTQVFGQA